MTDGIETERKYLIRLPEEGFLARGEKWEITQTYLTAAHGNRRVREVKTDGVIKYIYTEKHRLSVLSCREEEREIPRDAYLALLTEARADSAPVRKTRYRIPCGGHMLEIDRFPFWSDTALLEVELDGENDPFSLPDTVTVLREVTGDPLYKNTNIARYLKAHPNEALPQ